jgi:hypothetical protein
VFIGLLRNRSRQDHLARVSMKNNKQLTVALVNFILCVLDQVGPNSMCHCQRRPRCHGRWGVAVYWQETGVALDLIQLHQNRGDPRQDLQVKNWCMPLTLGLGFLNGHHLPPLTHRPIGRWNPQTRPPLREVIGRSLASSTVGALAPTRLR